MTKRLKLWQALAFVVVFLAGGAAGFFGGAAYARHVFFGKHSGVVGHRMHEHLRHELQLTAEQNEKITPILDRLDQRMQAIRDETGHKVRDAMSRSHEEIVPLLTPEQQTKLEKMREHHRHILRLHGGEPPPPPPDGP